MYCDAKDSEKRKSSIIVLNIILESLVKWFAPILSFTTEEIFMLINKDKKSIHLEKFIKIPKNYENKELNKKWSELKKIRDICNIGIEEKRATKEIGSSLEAILEIKLNEKTFQLTKDTDFSELCITSGANVTKVNVEEISAKATKAEGEKCSVCWKITKGPCNRHTT